MLLVDEALERAGSVSAQDRDTLIRCYRGFRGWAHARALQNESSLLPADAFADERRAVLDVRRRVLGA